MIAWLNLRHNLPERVEAVTKGLQVHGFKVKHELPTKIPGPRDILLTWNRIGVGHDAAKLFEREGCKVLVMENASWGNGFRGGHWYTLARTFHNQSARVPYGGPERWDALHYELAPWRVEGGQVVILPQRGIGPPGVAMPLEWPRKAQRLNPGARLRAHPGRGPETPLAWDLQHASRVLTWGSGAAIKALMMGIPVRHDMPNWIGAQDNTDTGRLEMLRRLAWAQWTLQEFTNGSAFAHVLA